MNIITALNSFTFGETSYLKGGRFGPISQPQLEFVLVQSGAVSVSIDGDELSLIEGYSALVPSKSHLQYDFRKNIDTRISWCEATLPVNPQNLLETLSLLPKKLPVSRRMLDLHRMGLGFQYEQGDQAQIMEASIGRTLFQEYVYQAQILQRKKPIHKSTLRAKLFMEQNIATHCTLTDIAIYANATPQYLTRVFKRDLGQTPIAYLWTIRSQKALQLIRNSGLSVSEIAFSCGYENANHFSRHIKEKFGATATELRRRKWG